MDIPRKAPTRAAARLALGERLRASGVHLACCIAIAALVLGVVFWGWYPPPLDRISGLGAILVIMLGADVALGPLVTLIVFDRTKKHLKFDLAVIVLVQASALAYGLYTVDQGRPAYLVFVKDRFELVAPADIKRDDAAAAHDNAAAKPALLRPKWVAAKGPTDPQERSKLLFDSLQGGKDVQHLPRFYVPYQDLAREAAARAAPLETLRQLNPDKGAAIDDLPAKLGLAPDMLRFLPLKGRAGDATVIVHARTGEVLHVMSRKPWS